MRRLLLLSAASALLLAPLFASHVNGFVLPPASPVPWTTPNKRWKGRTTNLLLLLLAHDDDNKKSMASTTTASEPPATTTAENKSSLERNLRQFAMAAALTVTVFAGGPLTSFADGQTKEFKLPPIDFADKNRCTLQSSSIGQANAARDKLYDLRQCKISGAKASGYDLSGVLMSGTDVSNANFADAQFSKAYLHDSNFDGADFTNAIVDRASFTGSSLRGTIFTNAVLTGTSFEKADLENADFTEAYLGDFDIRAICKNPTLKGENPTTGAPTKESVGCRN